ncbi:MAG: GAF domain-containing protein [Bacteroidales bacterium]
MRPDKPYRNPGRDQIVLWVVFVLLIVSSLVLLGLSWNQSPGERPGVPLLLLWLVTGSSAAFLFFRAAFRPVDSRLDEKSGAEEPEENPDRVRGIEKKDKEEKQMDFTATARKLVRRTPDDCSLEEALSILLTNLAKELEIMSGMAFLYKDGMYVHCCSYASQTPNPPEPFHLGEGLGGQVARNGQTMVLSRLPEGYLDVLSGLGKSKPTYLALVPLMIQNQCVAVVECCGFKHDPHHIEQLFRIFARDVAVKLEQTPRSES